MSANGVFVFLGPSLPVADARAILDATYLPPVKMGDVQALLAKRPRIVCIADGYFERVPAVWHKEILAAIAQGVRVVGASSMGALRAAELCAFGMEGVGGIFEAFRDGALTADDEVTIVHASAEDDYRPSSEALVNLRDGLALAETRGILSSAERDALVLGAKETFYPERSWGRVFADAKGRGIDASRVDRLRAMVASERPNAKRRDAIAALKHVAATLDHVPPPPSFDFEPTEFWHRLVSTTARGPSEGMDEREGALASSILDHARLTIDDFRALRDRALLAILATAEAGRGGIRVAPEQLSKAAARIRLRHGLQSAERTHEWLAANGLTATDLTELCRLEVICDEIASRHGRTLEDAIASELKHAGRFGEHAKAVVAQERALAAMGAPNPSLEDAGVDSRALLDWYKERFRPLLGGVETHARERGFANVASFVSEVVRAYCAEKKTPSA